MSYFEKDDPTMIADLLDVVLWDMNRPDVHPIDEYLAELRARPDADTPDIQQAIAVLVDYQNRISPIEK